jgi:CHAT domain-containing protein
LTPPPFADPSEFLRHLSGGPSSEFKLDNPEEYLDIAVARWLPAAGEDESARQAASQLGRLLQQRQSDTWLFEAVGGTTTHARSWRGFLFLQKAIERNAAGDPTEALRLAHLAQGQFTRETNRPGWLRARLEEVYALHRQANGRSCLFESLALEQSLKGRSFMWVEIQTALETSVCATMVSDFALARPPLRRAAELARGRYRNLELRAQGLEASLETVTGNGAAAWAIDRSGLARYFNSVYPVQRGYQFYSDLSFIAQNVGYRHLAAILGNEAANMIALTSNHSMTAMATYRYAMLADQAGLKADAADAFLRASGQFSELPQNDTTSVYRTEGQVGRALIDADRGEFEAAADQLRLARRSIGLITNVTILMRYYQALGNVKLHERDIDSAEAAFRKSVTIAESGFSALQTSSQRASWTVETRNAYRGLAELLLRLRDKPVEALRLWTEYRAESLKYGTSRGTLARAPTAAFSASASDTPTLLTYAVFKSGLAIWLSNERDFKFYWVDVPEQQLQAIAERFAQECADEGSPSSARERDGRWLYDHLILPAEPYLAQNGRIVLQVDGPISRVPFAALPSRSERFFGVDHSLTLSLGMRLNGTRDGVTARSRAVVIGAPALKADWAQSFPPLPEAAREARTVAGLFSNATLLLGADANLQAIREKLADVEVFHFAGHALSDGSAGALLVADPLGAASLNSGEIEKMRLRQCRLAVLSACSTGTGEGAAYGEGLAGAFLRAGVRRVVATRWQVDSRTARMFVEALYRELFRGVPIEVAMHNVASALREQPATTHPAAWAAFELYEAATPPGAPTGKGKSPLEAVK